MKKMFCLLFLALIQAGASFSITVPKQEAPSAANIMIPLFESNQKISLKEFLSLTPRDYKARTGHRLGLKRTIEMKYAQKRLKTAVEADGTVNTGKLQKQYGKGFQFHWGGFLLGFFFSLLGVLVTLFIFDDNRRSRITSSTMGATIVIVALALALRAMMVVE